MFQIIQYIKIFFKKKKKKNCHLIATHSMAVKDSNFLVFLSCHVIQTLICLHISYLGVKKNTSPKAVIFRRELGPYQTTPAPALSAIHQRLCEWNVKYRNCTTMRGHCPRLELPSKCSSYQVTEPCLFLCFLLGIFPSWGLCSKTQLQQNGHNWVSSPKPLEFLKHSPRHGGFNSLWNHRWLGSISSLLELQP